METVKSKMIRLMDSLISVAERIASDENAITAYAVIEKGNEKQEETK